MRKTFLIPLSFFVLIFFVLWRGLALHASEVPSPLLNQPAPAFKLPTLANPKVMTSNKDFLGHVTLVNVWASWCSACAEEFPLLIKLGKNKKLFFYGITYKDDHDNAKRWLSRGNPYRIVATDDDGRVAIDWGVYGTPELFILDKKGVIRFKQIGAIDEETWENILYPIVKSLEQE